MKKKHFAFPAWLVLRRTAILYFFLVYLIFAAVYALYGYPWGVAGYALLISLVLGLALAAVDFIRFAVKRNTLREIASKYPLPPLPEPRGPLEAAYTALITDLEAERGRLAQEGENTRRDAEEYYMLWAHQVKTPIAAMRLLLQGADVPSDLDLPAMRQELFRIEQYVEMVLQYQRLSSLQSDLLFREHSISGLVKKAAKSCSTLFIQKKLPLDISGVRGAVITDEKWFCFVLEQLLTNAVKYTARGEVRVYTASDGALVVSDTGTGIAPEDLPRVFERGFTGQIGRSERSSTGIGLYLCREILRRLGFGMSIESASGVGTSVHLRLQQTELELD